MKKFLEKWGHLFRCTECGGRVDYSLVRSESAPSASLVRSECAPSTLQVCRYCAPRALCVCPGHARSVYLEKFRNYRNDVNSGLPLGTTKPDQTELQPKGTDTQTNPAGLVDDLASPSEADAPQIERDKTPEAELEPKASVVVTVGDKPGVVSAPATSNSSAPQVGVSVPAKPEASAPAAAPSQPSPDSAASLPAEAVAKHLWELTGRLDGHRSLLPAWSERLAGFISDNKMTTDSCKDFLHFVVRENVSEIPTQSSVQFIGKAKDPCECICTKPWLLPVWRSARLAAKKLQGSHLTPTADNSGKVAEVNKPQHQLGNDWIETAKQVRAERAAKKARKEAEDERLTAVQEAEEDAAKKAEQQRRSDIAAARMEEHLKELERTRATTDAQNTEEKKADAAIWGDDDFWADQNTLLEERNQLCEEHEAGL